MIPKHKLQNCKVLPSRYDIISSLKKNGTCAEIGINKGFFSQKIIELNKPKELHLIDINEEVINNSKLIFEKKNNIKYVIGDSRKILLEYPTNYFDWVFIDTDHTYDTTKIEIEHCKRILKKDGVMLLHDYIPVEYVKSYETWGVIGAVNEFVENSDWEFKFISLEPHMFITVALSRINNLF